MTILNIEWKHDDRFVPVPPNDIDSTIAHMASTTIGQEKFAHKYYQIYRDNLRAALLDYPIPEVPVTDTCASKVDHFACQNAKNLAIHIHFTDPSFFRDSIIRLMGGCLCK